MLDADGEQMIIDSKPSGALTVALRAGVPVCVKEELLMRRKE